MSRHNFQFQNGDKVQDQITGFEGVVTGRCDYITGCNQYLLQPKSTDGTCPDSKWFDENRLFLTRKEAVTLSVDETDPGGPAQNPAPTK